MWGRITRLLSVDDPETGRLVRYVVTALLGWTLATAGPAEPLVWALLSVSMACWLLFVALDPRAPRPALAALALGSATAALAIGHGGSDGLIFLLTQLMLFGANARTPVPWILAVAAADLVLMVGGMLRAGAAGGSVAVYASVLGSMLVVALHRRQYRLGLADRARAAALDERARIARELHDVLAHSLGALRVQLEVADALLTEKRDVAAAAERVRRSLRLATDGLIEARSAVAALREDVPPLPDALAALAAQHRHDHAAAVEIRTHGPARPLAPAVEVGVLRTAREALTNAAKHAPGARVDIDLTYAAGSVLLTVDNPSSGTAPPRPAGFGLVGMRERLALIGGTLDAGRREGTWRVTVEVRA
ncbi:sensor histidine kinase [Nonomuraea typhae]|uniref:sensor histidine kinase n=1 Tax=Nonomuraea typhae TaxID=2603600 RepID=UPI001C936860|nr:histidine kinase [Nonomuraea typhae]